MKHMQRTFETRETFSATCAHLLVVLQWKLIDAELEVTHAGLADGSRSRWEARAARDARHERGCEVRGQEGRSHLKRTAALRVSL
jgi:ribosomal protein S13